METKYCKNCGELINKEAIICVKCGCQVEEMRNNLNLGQIINSKKKDKWIAFFLCLFLGGIGGHKFYEGKIGMGILYLFTIGLFGFGVLIDLIVILTKEDVYYV